MNSWLNELIEERENKGGEKLAVCRIFLVIKRHLGNKSLKPGLTRSYLKNPIDHRLMTSKEREWLSSWLCRLCSEVHVTEDFFEALDHATSHTGQYRYRCNYCQRRDWRRSAMRQHMASVHATQDLLFYSVDLPPLRKEVLVWFRFPRTCLIWPLSYRSIGFPSLLEAPILTKIERNRS